MTFSNRLRRTRLTAGFTQKQLAKVSGLGITSVGAYERGQVDPSSFALCRLADALHVSVDYLLGRTDKL